MLEDFCKLVKDDCAADREHFNFYFVPDLIVRKGYKRKDYEHIIKLLKKVKENYLAQKRTGFVKNKIRNFL